MARSDGEAFSDGGTGLDGERNGERVAPFTTPEQQPLDIFSFVLIAPSPPFQPSRSATHAQM